MKVLVIPDVHLKPWMFQRASELMKEIKADRAVCLSYLVPAAVLRGEDV